MYSPNPADSVGVNWMKNRIKELREARGWSLEQLAEAFDDSTTAGTMHKLERGTMKLTTEWMEKLGRALGVDPIEIIDDRPKGGLAENAEPYTPTDGLSALKQAARPGVSFYRVTSDALNEVGILAGDILEVDENGGAKTELSSGDIVVANVEIGPGTAVTTVIREFVEPALLITNSRTDNAMPINIRTTRTEVIGVVIGSHRQLRTRA